MTSSQPETGARVSYEGDLTPLFQSGADIVYLVRLAIQATPPKHFPKKLIPLLVAGSFVLGACSAIDTSQVSSLQGSFSGLADAGLRNSGYTADFQYNSGFVPMVSEARKNYSDDQIRRELHDTQVETSVRLKSTSGNVEAQIARTNAQSPQGLELTSPWQIAVNPTGDGSYEIVVEGQECVTVYDQRKCTSPVETVIRGQMDIHPPQIAVNALRPSEDSQGLILQGQIQDGEAGSGVSEAVALSCDGSSSLPLALNGQGQFAAAVPPKLGDNCFLVQAKDKAGNSGGSSPQSLTYEMSVNPTLAVLPDGKLVVDVPISNNLFSGLTLRIDRCNEKACEPMVADTQVKAGSPLKTAPVSPRPGVNIFRTFVKDIFGNATDGAAAYDYDFSVASQAGVQEDGGIHITAQPKNNQLPKFTVQVSRCDGSNPVPAAAKDDGTFTASGIAPNVGDTCLAATATDIHGNSVSSQVHATYGMDLGQVHQTVEYKDKGAQLYLFGNAPAPVDISSLTFAGTQKDWRALGQTKPFTCSPQGEAVINGEKWQYSFMCALPSNAGDATIRFDFHDKWGHQYSMFYPASGKMIGELRDNPSGNEVALFIAQYMAMFSAAVATGGYSSLRAYRYVDNKKRLGRARTAADMVLNGGREVLEEYIRAPRRVFKVTEGEAKVYREAARSLELVQKGRLVEAMQVMNILDTGGSPALAEVKRVLLDSAVESVNKQFARIEQERLTHELSQRRVNSLMTAVRNLSSDPSWSQVSPGVARQALTYISSFRIANQAYGMSAHDFVLRHAQLAEGNDAKSQEGRRRMVDLLCHWRQFTAAEEFIRHVPGPEKKGYSAMLENAVREVKDYFVDELNHSEQYELHPSGRSHAPVLLRSLRDMRLGESLMAEFIALVDIRSAVLDRDPYNGMQQFSSFMTTYQADAQYALPYLQELAHIAASIVGNVYANKNPLYLEKNMINLCAKIISGQDAFWWANIPDKVRDQLSRQAEEILMVSLARERGGQEFIRFYGTARLRGVNDVKKTVSVLAQWKDYANSAEIIDSYPVEGDREKLHDWFEKVHLSYVRTMFVAAVRSGKNPAEILKSDYLLPPLFREQCLMLGEMEVSVRTGDYRRVLTYSHGLYAARRDQVDAVLNTIEYMVAMISTDFADTVAGHDPLKLADGTRASTAEALLSFQSDPLWRVMKFSGKAELIRNAREILTVTASFTEPEGVFVRSQMAHINRPAEAEAIISFLSSWRNLQYAYACARAYPVEKERANLEDYFNSNHVRPLRSAFSAALAGRTTYAVFFNGYRLPPHLESEFRDREQFAVSERKMDVLGLLQGARRLIRLDNGYLAEFHPSLEAALKIIHDDWARVITARDRKYASGSRFLELSGFLSMVRNEPWWEHQYASGFKAEVMKQFDELALVSLASAGFGRMRSTLPGRLADFQQVKDMTDAVVRWGYYNVAWDMAREFPDTRDRETLINTFNTDIFGGLKKRYLNAMESNFSASASFLSNFILSETHGRELSQLRDTFGKFLAWQQNDLPGWRYADFMVDELKDEVMTDVSKSCKYALFERRLPFEDAVAVARRYYDITYFVDGPYVPLFLGVSEQDVNAARKENDYYPLVAKMRRGMISLLNTLDSYSNMKIEPGTTPQRGKEIVLAYLVHSQIMNWFKPLKGLINAMPERNTKEGRTPYGEVTKLSYTLDIDISDEEKAYITLWTNWIWELFNNSINGKDANVSNTFKALDINPIIYYTSSSSGDKIEDKTNIAII